MHAGASEGGKRGLEKVSVKKSRYKKTACSAFAMTSSTMNGKYSYIIAF